MPRTEQVRESRTAVAKRTTEVTGEIMATTAEIVKPEEKGGRQLALPAFLRGQILKEAPGLSPTVQWVPLKDRPEQWVFGRFLAMRPEIGPNKSMMYEIADAKSGEVIGVWGGVILDRKMAVLNPPKHCFLLIQYLGDTQGKPGQNPARDFRVAVVQE